MARRPSKRVPRYREIAQILREELAGEVYSLGGLFPKELDLCERFGVSRFTVRNAMAELEAAGLVERRKAIGTIVRALEPTSAYVQTLDTAEGLLQYAPDTALEIIEMVELEADTELAAWFDVEEGQKIIRFGGVRSETATDRKLCWTDVYVLPEFAGLLEFFGNDTRPVFRIIEEEFGAHASKIEIEISSCRLKGKRASELDVEEGAPALRVMRQYTGEDGRVLEVSVSDHPEDRHTYRLEFSHETLGS